MPVALTVVRRTPVGPVRTVVGLGVVTVLLGCGFRLRRLGEGRPYLVEETCRLVVAMPGGTVRPFTTPGGMVSEVMAMVGHGAWTVGASVEGG